ncbi:MAG: hypothetical protein PVF68_14275 [Acidobacteriota bacterium]|jgi:hypothetical protein
MVREPIVPGEVGPWARRVKEALAALHDALHGAARARVAVLQQVLRADPELAHRVEDLERRQQRLLEEHERLTGGVEELIRKARDATGSNEPGGPAGAMRDRLLDWLGRRKDLGREAQLWLIEAYYRDRGAVD